MITNEMLSANEALKGLTEEQRAAIVTLSKNDENVVIANKVSEIHSAYDEDIKTITGKEKPPGVKTYDHLKSVLRGYVESGDVTTLKDQIKTLQDEKKDLEKKIKEGASDEALKGKVAELEQKISDKDTQLARLRDDLTSQKDDYENKIKTERDSFKSLRASSQFDIAKSGLKFKEGIPEVAVNAVYGAAKAKILSDYDVEFPEDGGMIFRDKEKGTVITDDKNLQKPATASGLLFGLMKEVIDEGTYRKGGGTGEKDSGGSDSTLAAELAGKSREEQDRLIRADLAKKGMRAGKDGFQEALTKAYEDYGLTKSK